MGFQLPTSTGGTPKKPEYLIVLANFLVGPLGKVPFNFWWNFTFEEVFTKVTTYWGTDLQRNEGLRSRIFSSEQWKKGPLVGWVFFGGWTTTQSYRDYFINHYYKDPYSPTSILRTDWWAMCTAEAVQHHPRSTNQYFMESLHLKMDVVGILSRFLFGVTLFSGAMSC